MLKRKNYLSLKEIIRKKKINNLRQGLIGGLSVKTCKKHGDSIVIDYVKNYRDYVRKNPNPKIDKNYYQNYWDGGMAYKALIKGALMAFNKYSDVNRVMVVAYDKDGKYAINIGRKYLFDLIVSENENMINAAYNTKIKEKLINEKIVRFKKKYGFFNI